MRCPRTIPPLLPFLKIPLHVLMYQTPILTNMLRPQSLTHITRALLRKLLLQRQIRITQYRLPQIIQTMVRMVFLPVLLPRRTEIMLPVRVLALDGESKGVETVNLVIHGETEKTFVRPETDEAERGGGIDGLEVGVGGGRGESVVAGVFECHGHEGKIKGERMRVIVVHPCCKNVRYFHWRSRTIRTVLPRGLRQLRLPS